MYCSSCSNSQCFICSVSITDYSHFSDSGPCRLEDDDEARVNAAVMQAQGQAITEALRSRDGVNVDALTVDKTLLPLEFNTTNDLPAPPINAKRSSVFPNVIPPANPIDRRPVEAEPPDNLFKPYYYHMMEEEEQRFYDFPPPPPIPRQWTPIPRPEWFYLASSSQCHRFRGVSGRSISRGTSCGCVAAPPIFPPEFPQ
jgi:hypothetical protein